MKDAFVRLVLLPIIIILLPQCASGRVRVANLSPPTPKSQHCLFSLYFIKITKNTHQGLHEICARIYTSPSCIFTDKHMSLYNQTLTKRGYNSAFFSGLCLTLGPVL